jgi:hypothetical protein
MRSSLRSGAPPPAPLASRCRRRRCRRHRCRRHRLLDRFLRPLSSRSMHPLGRDGGGAPAAPSAQVSSPSLLGRVVAQRRETSTEGFSREVDLAAEAAKTESSTPEVSPSPRRVASAGHCADPGRVPPPPPPPRPPPPQQASIPAGATDDEVLLGLPMLRPNDPLPQDPPVARRLETPTTRRGRPSFAGDAPWVRAEGMRPPSCPRGCGPRLQVGGGGRRCGRAPIDPREQRRSRGTRLPADGTEKPSGGPGKPACSGSHPSSVYF